MRSALLFSLLLSPLWAVAADLNIVTTTTDLQSLVRAIGKDHVETFAVAKGTQDPHQIEAKPSYMIKMRNANLVIAHGLELESAWLQPLIQGGRNPKIAIGTNGYLELGDKLDPIEVPKGSVSRAEGDVHPGGNPHFTLDPIRLGQAAVLIAERMGQLDPKNSATYKQNALALQKTLTDRSKEWSSRLAKTKITKVVTYHKTLNYFLNRFNIENPAQLEPRPGIPPTAAHLMEVIELMKKNSIRLVLIENLYDVKAGEKVAHELPSAKVVAVPVYVGGEPKIETNEQLIERLVKIIEDNSH